MIRATSRLKMTLLDAVSAGLKDDEEATSVGPPSPPPRDNNHDEPAAPSLWEHAWPLYVPSLVQAIALGVAIAVLPLRGQEDLGASTSMLGVIGSGAGLGSIIGGLFAGPAVAASGERLGLVAGCALMAAAALLGAGPSVAWLLASRVLLGVGASIFQVSRQIYNAAHVLSAQRGASSATIAGTTRLGTTIGPAAGGAVAHVAGSAAVFELQSGCFALAGLLLLGCQPRAAKETARAGSNGGGDAKGLASASSNGATPAPSQKPSGGGGARCGGFWHFHVAAARTAVVVVCLTLARASRELLVPLKVIDCH